MGAGAAFLLVIVVLISAACRNQPVDVVASAGDGIASSSTDSEVALATLTPTDAATNTPDITPTLSPTSTAAATFTPIPTSTNTPIPTDTPIPTVTFTPTKPPPLPTPSGTYSWTLQVPILMYHYISEPPEDADKYRTDLSVTPEDFRAQLAYLAENGYETVDLYDLSLAITAKRDLPEKPVIITIDDGYRDNYENAFPLLQEYGMRATIFVVTEFIDLGREEYLTWEMVEEMAAAGMRMEPHSKTHADLSGQEYDFVLYEILGAQQTLEAHIGYKPMYFCYPGGRYDETTLQVVEDLDMWGAVTTQSGRYHGFENRYEWPRLRMRNTTALGEFATFVESGEFVSGKPPDAES